MTNRITEINRRFGRIFNHKVTFDKERYRAKCVVPGFNYGDFDRAGYVNMYTVGRLFDTPRLFGYKEDLIDAFPTQHRKNSAMVMFSQRYTVSPALYQRAVMDFPMNFQYSISAVGRSSIIGEVLVGDAQSGDVLIKALLKMVNMDKVAKKARPLDPEVLAFYDRIADRESHEVFEDLRPPEVNSSIKMFSTERKVRHSDMDMLFHTNQATYMRYALDCAAEAVAAGAFSAFKDDICFYHAREAATIHFAESFAGDVVGVHTWEDETDPKVLHFTVTKNIDGRSQIIYYCYVAYI